MLTGGTMQDDLLESLKGNMRLDHFEEREIETTLELISALDGDSPGKVTLLCHALSRVSSTLIPRTLKHIRRASASLQSEDLLAWVERANEILDSEGVLHFVNYMTKSGFDELEKFRSPQFPYFREASGMLELYLRGISGKTIGVAPDNEAYTDTATVYLPGGVSRFRDHEMNLLLYEFMTAHKWAEIRLGTLLPENSAGPDGLESPGLEESLGMFPLKELATDLFTILEAFLVDGYISEELPGLMHRVGRLKEAEFEGRPTLDNLSRRTAVVEALYQYYLGKRLKGRCPPEIETLLPILDTMAGVHPNALTNILQRFYAAAVSAPGPYNPERPLFFFGVVRPDRISAMLKKERMDREKEIAEALRRLTKGLAAQDLRPKQRFPGRPRDEREYILVGEVAIEADGAVKRAVRRELPGLAIVKGSDLAGDAVSATIGELLGGREDREEREEAEKYDEWDYRRGDYRRRWCSLFEVESAKGDSAFVESTLLKYGGVVKKLRDQFETLRRYPRMTRMSSEGEMIDIDAAIDAFSDLRAGKAPAEKLYYRMERKARDIAVLFLVDMSDSTKGWVNVAEKEALVLMCEALEKLGDRYAIAGFSGSTRFECLYYRIKGFSETYSPKVRDRISGISARDYTRMGPAIRHSARALGGVDARKKLLVVIGDGQPQDIGEYGGDYAIEDTRMALVECKARRISPICVTLDKEAKAYVSRMYGEVNYFIIDDPRDLPRKLAECYRRLTT